MNIKDTVHLLLMHEEGGSSITNLEALDLTKRQAEVLTLLAQGGTNSEIASCGHQRAHSAQDLEHIFQKLAVPTRTAAINVALMASSRQGWMQLQEDETSRNDPLTIARRLKRTFGAEMPFAS